VGGGWRSSRGWRTTRQGQEKRLDNQPALLWRLIELSSGRRSVEEEMWAGGSVVLARAASKWRRDKSR
jgi:hypothetical protein